MEGGPDYEDEQTHCNQNENDLTEGEYMDSHGYPEGAFNSDMGLSEQYMYLENDSQDLDINAMLDDIDSRQPS